VDDYMQTDYTKPLLRITPHPDAPLFTGPDAYSIIQQVVSELASGNFNTSTDSEFYRATQQMGLVSLWAFLVVIAGFDGPYDKLTDHLHAEMTNFYQDVMYDGAKGACLIGRSHYKSSVFTHGGNSWEILRNPDISIGLGCGIEDRAIEFLGYTIDTFTGNEMFRWLYPYHHIGNFKSAQGCNQFEITLPNKKRNRRQPNIKTITAGGSTAGIHVDLLKLDDIITDQDLNSERKSSASMYKMTNWLKSSIRTLVKDWRESRVFLSGTRYAPDDAYEALMLNCKRQIGYWDELPEHYKEDPDGEWDIYYRMIEEKGRIIFPEAFTKEGLVKLEQEDPWTYWTQYFNNPFKSSFQELNRFKINECSLDYTDADGHSVSYFRDGQEHRWFLRDCDVIQVADPAASEKGRSAKTSRSAHVLFVTAPDERRFIIRGHADFVSPSDIFTWFFDTHDAFKNYIRFAGMEMQGPFKVFDPLFREEQTRRRKWIGFRPIKTSGDKDARIRTQLEPLLRRGLLYCVGSFKDEVQAELNVFPDGPKKDILDVVSMGVQESQVPERPEEIRRQRFRQEISRGEKNETTGY
jgi:hypothetical protein